MQLNHSVSPTSLTATLPELGTSFDLKKAKASKNTDKSLYIRQSKFN